MILRQVRYGKAPTLRGYRGGELVYRRNAGVNLVDGGGTFNGMKVSCYDGVFTINGTATGNVFMRFSHSYVQSSTNADLADPSYVMVPAKKITTLSAEYLGGHYDETLDSFNIVLRDSTNAAAVNLKFSGGMRSATETHANALAVFCLYFRAGFTASGLMLMPTLTYT